MKTPDDLIKEFKDYAGIPHEIEYVLWLENRLLEFINTQQFIKCFQQPVFRNM